MPAQNEVTLQITIDDQGTKTLTNVIRLLEQLQDTVTKTATSFKSIERSTDNLNKALGKTTTSTKQFEDRLDKLQKEFDDTRKATDRAENSMLDYSIALGAVAFGLSRVRDFGARQITGFVNASGRLENVSRAYESILGSATEARDAIRRLREAAQDPGLTFEVAARATRRFLAFGVSLEDSIQLTRNFANAAVVTGTSLAELDTGLQQVAKSIGTGKIEQDDLNSITERFGPIAQNIRREYGKTGEEVTKAFTDAGKSVADFALDVSSLEDQPKAAADTLANAVSNLQNAWNQLSTELGDVLLPTVKSIIELLTDLIESFNDLPPSVKTVTAVAGTLATAIAGIATAAVAVAAALGPLSLALGTAGIGGAAAGAATGIGGLTAGFAALAPYVVAGAAVVVGLGALAAIILRIKDASDDLADSTKRLNTELGDVSSVQAYNKALENTRQELRANISFLTKFATALDFTEIVLGRVFPGIAAGGANLLRELASDTEKETKRILSYWVNLEGDTRTVTQRLRVAIERLKDEYKALRESGVDANDEEAKSLRNIIKLLQAELKARTDVTTQAEKAADAVTEATTARTPIRRTGTAPTVTRPAIAGRRAQVRAPVSAVVPPTFPSTADFAQAQAEEGARIIRGQWDETEKRITENVAAIDKAWTDSFLDFEDQSGIFTRKFIANSDRILGSRLHVRNATVNYYKDEIAAATRAFEATGRFAQDSQAFQFESTTRQDEYTSAVYRTTNAFDALARSIRGLGVESDSTLDKVLRVAAQVAFIAQGIGGTLSGVRNFQTAPSNTDKFIAGAQTAASFLSIIGSIQTIGSIFHDPANDRLAELAGLTAGTNIGAIRAARRQNARDFSDSFGRGFERAQASLGASSGDHAPIEVTIPLIVNDKTTQEIVASINRMEQSGRAHIRTRR